MHNLVFSEKVLRRMNQYAENYRLYFEESYTDTGIWSEGMIIERFREIALIRKQDIRESITARLSFENVPGNSGNNTVVIPWRTKNLHVSWEDISLNVRSVKDLEIR